MSPRDATTHALVQQAQRGDRDALNELCEQCRPRLLRMIRCRIDPRLRPRVDASDVVQETLAVASRDLASYERQEGIPFFAWLRQIAWRQVLRASEQHIETGKRSILREQNGSDNRWPAGLAEALADASTPSGHLTRLEQITRVGAAVETLSDIDREVLVLRFVERLSTQEAAAVQGVSALALRKRLTRALERLGLLLADEWSESTKEPSDEGVPRSC